MKKYINNLKSSRRKFFRSLATGAASIGLWAASIPLVAKPKVEYQDASDPDAWFNKLKGKHKMVFDAVSANDGYQVVYTYTFLTTNNKTGTPDNEMGAMIVLRSKAIALAMQDIAWSKYKLGKLFKIVDNITNAAAERNIYWDPKEGEMPQLGMSIKQLQIRGVMFCVCESALTLTSGQYAKNKGLDPATVKNEWITALIPGVQLVPSGVWALNRAQERGASYCYAG